MNTGSEAAVRFGRLTLRDQLPVGRLRFSPLHFNPSSLNARRRYDLNKMKNLFEPAAVDEVKGRIAQLTPESPAQWGKMNAAQALAHCSASLRWTVGDTLPDPTSLVSIIGRLIKRKVIWGEEPLRRNTPTAKSLVMLDTRELEGSE